jgi:hypothetical protein
VGANTGSCEGWAEVFGEAIEELNSRGKSELLTSNAIDQSFEQRREAGRFKSTKASGEYRDPFIFRSRPIESFQIHLQAQHPVQCLRHL